MNWKTWLAGFAVCTALIIFGCLYLDVKLADFISKRVGLDFLLSDRLSNMPDLLLLLVCVITAVSWIGYIYLLKKPSRHCYSKFLELTGCAVPLAYILKDFLKELFGRTNARVWLLHPDQLGFHWFQGGGDFSAFPSGHMAVLTALMLAVSRYFPQLRRVCAGLLLISALALIITQYHFLSDIVAGVCLGLIVDLLACRGLLLIHHSIDRTVI